jgi:hypothetical protein
LFIFLFYYYRLGTETETRRRTGQSAVSCVVGDVTGDAQFRRRRGNDEGRNRAALGFVPPHHREHLSLRSVSFKLRDLSAKLGRLNNKKFSNFRYGGTGFTGQLQTTDAVFVWFLRRLYYKELMIYAMFIERQL